ncbi:hypothetical protein TNCV_77621 [Trichonephila clavipes]|nr:hypothetical protein TNCV_77621 [Trichonephila clavipes]
MDRPVPPAFPVPPGTPYQKQDSTCSHLLSSKDRGSPATSQTINQDVNRHPLSTFARQQTSKIMPHTNDTYVTLCKRSPTTFEVANIENTDVPIGVYHHISAFRPHQDPSSTPLISLRKRGRPGKTA